jgi:glutaminyl-tRNA synthetase
MAETTTVDENALIGREIPSQINTSELLAEHARITNGKIRTRFPPEPNGYLHVGHAKSMFMNFQLSFEKLGVAPENRQTYFRFDDTNPEAESDEYIQSLHRDVAWMGWKPDPITYSSDYFQELYDLAVELIKRDKAYVCYQTKAEIEASREICKKLLADPTNEELLKLNPNSPWRDRPIAESLKEFENMRKGKYEGGVVLRMKMDMKSPNPNMWDQVAYRIKFMPHPHAGSDWCIYPTYDYTHCIIDSLEHIDYSICTLEFETRRESYYWVLEALDLYRPKVYEMSRLNLTNTVLSKRRLLKLVDNGYMRGWNDPRMPTISGLRRRGYTPTILNNFCREIGVTRNANVVQYERLEAQSRTILHETSPRIMGVINPIKVIIKGNASDVCKDMENKTYLDVPNFPFDLTRGTHPVPVPIMDNDGNTIIYIDGNDFRLEDDPDYFGLAPDKLVGLRYYSRILCDKVDIDDNTGKPTTIYCSFVPDSDTTKPKAYIQWVGSDDAINVEVRLYNNLFIVEEPTDDWEAQLNKSSEEIKTAMIDSSIFIWNPVNLSSFQFERIGFFNIDEDTIYPSDYNDKNGNSNIIIPTTTPGSASIVTIEDTKKSLNIWKNNKSNYKLVMNMTVGLNSSKPRSNDTAGSGGAPVNRSRKAEQIALAAEKERLKCILPCDLFKSPPHEGLYKEYDADGIPTVLANGEPVTKSASKKLKKDWEKHKKFYEKENAK